MPQSRLQDTAPHEHGALNARAGVVAGRLQQFADTLDTTPDAVLAAIDAHSVPILNDTAEAKSRREKNTRPTDPGRRCLALTTAAFDDLRAAVQACDKRDPPRHGRVRRTAAHTTTAHIDMATAEKSEDIRCRVTPATMERVKAAARREGRSVSGYVRSTLRRQLDVEERLFGSKGKFAPHEVA